MPCSIALSLQGTKTPNACTWHIQFQSSGKSTWLNLGIIFRFDPGISLKPLNLKTKPKDLEIALPTFFSLHSHWAMPSAPMNTSRSYEKVHIT